MKWEDVSNEARFTMSMLGDFSPTVNPEHCMVEGYIHSKDDYERAYACWDNNDLREMAKHLIEVADWLEVRATVQVIDKTITENMQRCREDGGNVVDTLHSTLGYLAGAGVISWRVIESN